MTKHPFATALALGAALLVSAPGAGAQQVAHGWMPWLGCWEPLEVEDGREGLVCFRPIDGGVEMFSVVGGELESTDPILTNGREREVSREGCTGTERSEISTDGRRVFYNGRFACGDGVPRVASGIMSLSSPVTWLDVRSVDVEGETVAWVQRYRLASAEQVRLAGVEDASTGLGMAVRSARMSAAAAIDIDDVVEASLIVDPKAVEAWVAERGDRFELDAAELVRLADLGVPGSLTDVMIAVSHPSTFRIDPDGQAEQREIEYDRDRAAYPGRFGYRPLYWDPFYYGYAGLYSPYRYGRYGGYYYGSGYYGYRPTTVIVDRRPGGRMVNGRGYTRGSSAGSNGGGGRASAGGSTQAGPSSRATGRTAKPRRGGSSGYSSAPSRIIRSIGRVSGIASRAPRASAPSRPSISRPAPTRSATSRTARRRNN